MSEEEEESGASLIIHSLTHSLTHSMFPPNTRTAGMFSLLNMTAAATASPSECYVAPSCTATEFYNEVTGFTNDTGFAAPGSSECCQVSHVPYITHTLTHTHTHTLTHTLTHTHSHTHSHTLHVHSSFIKSLSNLIGRNSSSDMPPGYQSCCVF
jgi:hypothetical protein